MDKSLPKIYVIIGPTASGKSDVAVELAKKVKGEIVSVDSRQVFKHFDIGSGKITKKEMKGVKHYCLDIVDPVKYSKKYKKNGETFSVQEYLKYANKAIKEILKKKKTPILCGGTGFYIDAILYGLPKNAKPNPLLRTLLEKEDLKSLLTRIKKLNKEKYLELTKNENPSERNNKRRLIRIIEILEAKKSENKIPEISKRNTKLKYEPEFIFIEKTNEEIRERINLRLKKRLEGKGKNNLINEIKFLRNELKLDDKWLLSLGLEYKYVTRYLRRELTYEEMIETLQNKIWQFAKRQILWNKRYKNAIIAK
ncbi:tRNA dimethylallyltransferase [bioreactor metagenome]|uniref:tRNA dimethylallyltransferase n=1 Tax=bioreactor metagenome TaxID=1076179 RepID=A0A644T5L3_9ZZZZ|nr:tRNA (adenosine(37)-N6)-dimethylallyltransferase MiaA [Candidatus Elulimicrobiales bacterium]